MAKKYVDLEVAIKAIENLSNCYNGFSDTYDKACIIGVLEELPAADVVDVGTVEAYGYKIKDLLMFAIACRNAGVTEGDLRMFANNLDFAWREMQASIEGTFENALLKLFKEGMKREDGEHYK